jgi:hypothetical protein
MCGDDALAIVFDVDPMIGDPHDLSAPEFAPAAGCPAADGAATPHAGIDTSATWIGASSRAAPTGLAGWSAYPAN